MCHTTRSALRISVQLGPAILLNKRTPPALTTYKRSYPWDTMSRVRILRHTYCSKAVQQTDSGISLLPYHILPLRSVIYHPLITKLKQFRSNIITLSLARCAFPATTPNIEFCLEIYFEYTASINNRGGALQVVVLHASWWMVQCTWQRSLDCSLRSWQSRHPCMVCT